MLKVWFVMLLVLLPVASALQASSSSYSSQIVFGSGGVGGEELTLYNASVTMGQHSIGNVTTGDYGTYVGFQYVSSDFGFLPQFVSALAFVLLVADYGMEWVKLNWN